MNSSGRVCVHRIFCEWKECSESRKPSIVVYSQWKLEFKVDQDSQAILVLPWRTVSLLYELLTT